MTLHNNLSMADAIRVARKLGVQVAEVRRTGEIRFHAPAGGASYRVNGRKKDAGRGLVSFLRKASGS